MLVFCYGEWGQKWGQKQEMDKNINEINKCDKCQKVL